MTDITATQDTASIDLNKAGAKVIIDRITEVTESLYTTSKEKYERKAKIIEEAEDMTTEEKLLAMDKNYDRHSLEVWQGIIAFGASALLLYAWFPEIRPLSREFGVSLLDGLSCDVKSS